MTMPTASVSPAVTIGASDLSAFPLVPADDALRALAEASDDAVRDAADHAVADAPNGVAGER